MLAPVFLEPPPIVVASQIDDPRRAAVHERQRVSWRVLEDEAEAVSPDPQAAVDEVTDDEHRGRHAVRSQHRDGQRKELFVPIVHRDRGGIRMYGAALELPVARVEQPLHPFQAERDRIVLAQVLADGQHALGLGLALLQTALGEEPRDLEGELRVGRVDGHRPEVDLLEGEAAPLAGRLSAGELRRDPLR